MAASERSLNVEARPLAFLSHAGQDADTAKALARALRDSGVEVWLDVERLRPGDRWMQSLEAALQEAKAFLLYVGATGVRNWVDNELRVALDRSTKESDFRLIPILGPGSDPESLPPFLKLYQWLDFRTGFEPVADLKRLIEAVSRKPTEAVSVLPPDRDPFRGLFVFDVEDALLFYGRERETAEVVERLSVANFLAVVGDSGTGKSSLVRAGLVPALHRGRFSHRNSWIGSWRIAILRPGAEPFREMAEALPQLDPDMAVSSRLPFISSAREELSRGPEALQNAIAALVPAGAHTLLIVDQFEELFTLTPKLEERGRFIDTLLAATNASGTRAVHVVITLRADFYSQCWQHEQLVERINENQYLVRRVGPSQLRQVIEKPLSLAGATAEAGLVDALLHDVGDEPGNLPLLEHALLQLWRKRKGRTLTHQAYEDMGRLEGALRNHANEVFESLHNDEERRLVRRIFVSLTQLGEGAEDTRRRSMKADLLALGAERVSAANVLKTLVDARLLTTSGEVGTEDGGAEDVVEVAHEALIREWPLLRSWIDDNRESLRIERRIRRAADEWNEIDRDPSALLRGTRLAEAVEWAQENRQELPQKAREFLDASVGVREEELTRERERQQAELETERRLKEEAERRAQAEQSVAKQARKNLRVTQITAAVVVVAFVTAAWAFVDASRQRDRVQRYALSDKESLVLDLLQVKPVEALARAVQAVGESLENFGQVPQSVEAALSTAVEVAREKNVIAETIVSATLHPNSEQIIAATADNRIRVFTLDGTPLGEDEQKNLNTAGPRDVLAAGPGDSAGNRDIRAVVACPAQDHDCSTVIVLNGNSVEKWENGELRSLFTEDGEEIRGIALNNEHTVALLTNDARSVVLKQLDSNVPPRRFSFDLAVDAFALSPNGELLAVSGRETTPVIVVVDTSTSRRMHKLVGHQAPIHALAFSPDGRTLASGNGVVPVEDTPHEAAVKVWDLRTGDAVASSYLTPFGFSPSDGITSLAFSSDGRTLAAGTYEGAVHVWNEDSRRMGEPFPAKRGTVHSVSFTRSSDTLFTASQKGVQLWDLRVRPTGVRLEHVGKVEGRDTRLQVNWVDVPPQGDSLLTGVVRSGSPRGALQKWSLEGVPLGEPFGPSDVYIFAISKDGRIASGNRSGVQLWTEDGQLLVQSFDGPASAKRLDSGEVVPERNIWALGFAPDSSYLVGGGDAGVLFQWDLNGNLIRELEGRHAGKVWSLAVREDAIVSVSASGRGQPGTVLLHRSDGSLMDHVDFRGSRLEGPFTGESVQVVGVDFFPSTSDGFVTGDSSGVARIWSPSGRVLREFQAHVGVVNVVRVSRDGRYIASGGSDQVVRVWDARGSLLRQIRAHSGEIVGLSFDPAGNLVSGSLDGEARIWSSSLWKPNWRARLEVACSRLKQHPFLNNRSSRIAVGACQTCDQHVWTTDRSGPAKASVCGDASGRVRSVEANLWSPKESSTPPATR